MNIYIHQDMVKAQIERTKITQRYGMILIVIAVLISIGSFVNADTQFLLFVGYVPAITGLAMLQLAKAAQRNLENAPRADTALNAELKGLNNKYSLHHYIKYGDTWIPHLFVAPSGLIVMVSSNAIGPVTCNGTAKGDRWKTPTNMMDRWSLQKPPIGNPSQELDAALLATKELLTKVGKPDVPVTGFVLFTRNPDVQVTGCSYQGVPMNEARLAIRDFQQEMDSEREDSSDIKTMLTADDRRRLNTFLAPSVVTLPTSPAPAKR